MSTQSPLKRLWEMGKGEHGKLIAAIVLASAAVMLGIIPYFIAAFLIEGLLNHEIIAKTVMTSAMIAFAAFVLKSIMYSKALSLSHRATFQIMRNIRAAILDKLPRLPLGTIIDTPSGKLKQIIVDQVETMERPLAHLLPELSSNILTPVLIFIFLLFLDWRMALLSLVSVPVGMAFMMLVMVGYGKDYEGSVKVSQELNSSITEYVNGIEVIKAFNQAEGSYKTLAERAKKNASYYYNWMRKCQTKVSFSKALAPATLITILPVGWLFYSSGTLSSATFILTIMLSMGIAEPLLHAFDFTDTLAQIGTIVNNVDSLLKAEEQNHPDKPVEMNNHGIMLKNVSFSYDGKTEILHDVTATVPEGGITAIVGPSGGGKSTIAKLIAGFWDIKQGELTIGGKDIKSIPLSQLYDMTAYVGQDNFLFDDTVMENIRVGKKSASDKDVMKAAELSGCLDFITKLENGYGTRVGSGGTHLSGGERQRLAIARAMLKDAPVVIFDEATAYMDPENETKVQNAIRKLIQGKTVIMIAHRLSTITDADNILVVDRGRIEAEGKHDELLASCPLYRSMYQAHMSAKDGE